MNSLDNTRFRNSKVNIIGKKQRTFFGLQNNKKQCKMLNFNWIDIFLVHYWKTPPLIFFLSLSTTVRAKRKEKLHPCMCIYFQTKTDITKFYNLNYNFRTSLKNAVMLATNETQYRTPWRVSCQRTPLELAVISLKVRK